MEAKASKASPAACGQPNLPRVKRKAGITNEKKGEDFKYQDKFICWTLFVISFCIRFYRLGFPASVVFDEYHFGTFVDNILNGETHFDIHPPLGKLTLAFFGWLVGYRPVANFDYDEIGKDYGSVLYYPLRELAAIFGVVTVPLMYSTARRIGVSWVGSLLSASMFCFDNLNIIESRLILTDSQIVFYLVLSLYCALCLWRTRSGTRDRYFWLTATGLISGCSISVKWTALVTPGLISIVSFLGVHFLDRPVLILECLWAAFVGIGLYISLFYVHFKTLTHTGPGVEFFPDQFQATLVGDEKYDAKVARESFYKLFLYLNNYMFVANAGTTTRHHWESYWYQWIVNWRGVLYYGEEINGKWAMIYLFCNPIVCWTCTLCVGVFVIGYVLCMRYRETKWMRSRSSTSLRYSLGTCMFLFCGWVLNLVPYMLVDRSAFVYHYLPGLIYAQLLSGVVVDQLPFKVRIFVMLSVLVAIIASFFYYAPWVYFFPLSNAEHAARRWLKKWN